MTKICNATPSTLNIYRAGGFQTAEFWDSGASSASSNSGTVLCDDDECSSSTTCLEAASKQRRSRRISFSDIHVYEFPLVLGDNPSVSDKIRPVEPIAGIPKKYIVVTWCRPFLTQNPWLIFLGLLTLTIWAVCLVDLRLARLETAHQSKLAGNIKVLTSWN